MGEVYRTSVNSSAALTEFVDSPKFIVNFADLNSGCHIELHKGACASLFSGKIVEILMGKTMQDVQLRCSNISLMTFDVETAALSSSADF